MKEWATNQMLPQQGQIVECYGNRTYFCEEDMEEPAWHKVKFEFLVSVKRLAKEIPVPTDSTLIEEAKVYDYWGCVDCDKEEVILVTKWRSIK